MTTTCCVCAALSEAMRDTGRLIARAAGVLELFARPVPPDPDALVAALLELDTRSPEAARLAAELAGAVALVRRLGPVYEAGAP